MSHRFATHLFAALSLLLSACASTQPLEPRNLPYRIGIVPMEDPTVGEISPGELPGEATELTLEFACDEVTEAVASALEEYCFSSVALLDVGDADLSAGSYDRQRLLVERAREAGVDLVVELGLRYDREVYRENANIFWMNFPLFLFASPSNWFLADNDYYADVELTTSIYDLHALEAGGLSIGDPTARVVSTNSRYTGTKLDFVDRSDGLGDYLLSVLIPSGFLARESESTHEMLQRKILEELQVQVVQGIQGRRVDLVRSGWIAPVFVDPDKVTLSHQDDSLLVRGDVLLRRDGLAGRVHALHMSAGAENVTVQPASARSAGAGEYDVVPFEALVPLSAEAGELRLECEAGSRDRYVRSYTFSIPAR